MFHLVYEFKIDNFHVIVEFCKNDAQKYAKHIHSERTKKNPTDFFTKKNNTKLPLNHTIKLWSI